MATPIHNPLLGAIWMLVFCVVATLGDGVVRLISLNGFPVIEGVFIRASVGTLVLLPFVLRSRALPVARPMMKLYLLRGIFAFVGATSWFYLLKYAEFTSLVAIGFTSPLFAALLAVLFLGENLTGRKILAFVIGLAGAMVVINPLSVSFNLYLILGACSSMVWAVSLIFAKKLARQESPVTIAFFFGLFNIPLSIFLALPVWQWPSLGEWGYLAIFIACATIAQVSLAKAFSHADLSALMPLEFSMLIFAALFSFFVFGEIASWNTVLGGAIILASGYLILQKKSVKPLIE